MTVATRVDTKIVLAIVLFCRSIQSDVGHAVHFAIGSQGTIPMFEGALMEPDSVWTAGFVSKSNSYKAWIGSEEAKQTKEASSQRIIEFQVSQYLNPDNSRRTGVDR